MSTKKSAVLLKDSSTPSVQKFLVRMETALHAMAWRRDKRLVFGYAIGDSIEFRNILDYEDMYRSSTTPGAQREAAPPPPEIVVDGAGGPSRTPSLKSAMDEGGLAQDLWKRLQEEVFNYILTCIKDDTIYRMLKRECKSEAPALEAWSKLKELVAQTSTASIQSRIEQFTQMKQEKGQSVLAFAEDLMTVADQLEEIGEKLSENFILAQLHKGLLPAYSSVALISKGLGHGFKKTKLELHNFEVTQSSKMKNVPKFREETRDKRMAAHGAVGGRGSAGGNRQGGGRGQWGGRQGKGRGGGRSNGCGGGGQANQPQREPAANKDAGGETKQKCCFTCGSPDHLAMNCPKRHPASRGHA